MTDMSPEEHAELREKAVRAMSEPPGTTGMLRIWGERLLALLDQNDALRARCAALEAAVRTAADDLECSRGHGLKDGDEHYCPNCDRGLGKTRFALLAALLPVPSAEPEEKP